MLKVELLTEEKIKDLMEASSLDEALGSLRETSYATVADAHNLDEALKVLFLTYAQRVRKIAKFSPKVLESLVLAFIREDMLKDVMSVIGTSLLGGSVEPKSLITYNIEESPLRAIEQDPESVKNYQRLIELLSSRNWLKPYLNKILEIVQKGRDIKSLNLLSSSLTIELYSDALEKNIRNMRDLEEAKKILCPRFYIISLGAVLESSILNNPPKTLSEVSPLRDSCKAWSKVLKIYEREQEFEALVNSLKRELENVSIEGETFDEVLVNARISVLKKIKKEALVSYSGYPFSLKLLLGALNLLRLEYEIIKMILSAISLGLKPEEYEERIMALSS